LETAVLVRIENLAEELCPEVPGPGESREIHKRAGSRVPFLLIHYA